MKSFYKLNKCHVKRSRRFGFFIMKEHKKVIWYLHKDGLFYSECGEENFFKTFEGAKNFLKKKYPYLDIQDILPNKLFEI